MINKVLKFIEKYQLFNKTILVGFSGGPDSMCLLDILYSINKDKNLFNLVAVHYNHNWRGDIALHEQECCKKYCEDRNIEFYTETASDDIKKNETEARELRYSFFERAKKKYNADAIFTAHNWDDNAETVLYRIIKGTGIVGLKGILPKRDCYYRPLIDIHRTDIEAYCAKNNLCPNIDNSNNDTVHKRNLIRHDIFPMLAEINSDVKKALNNLCYVAQSESEIVDEYISKLSKDLYSNGKILTSVYKTLSNPVKQKIIYNLIYNSQFDYTMDRIENILEFIEKTIEDNKPSKFSLSSDNWLYVDSNIMEIIQKTEQNNQIIEIVKNGTYTIGENEFSICDCDEYIKQKDEYSAMVDLTNCKNLCIRTRRDGDIIRPLGFKGTMKLKKYLMEKKIPQHKRDKLVLLTNNEEVLWVGGVGMSDKIKVVNKPTHLIKLNYKNGVIL
ncbi:tRNA lysidine(34) synthetase TilS [bacterium]|nr:tRNA lysidine(34) synthetase TilS [bacterium]